MGLRENIFEFDKAWDKTKPEVKAYLSRPNADSSPRTRLSWLQYATFNSFQRWMHWTALGLPVLLVSQIREREREITKLMAETGIAVCAAVDMELDIMDAHGKLPEDPYAWMVWRCHKRKASGFTWDDFDALEAAWAAWGREQG